MRTYMMAGNWKMNKTLPEAVALSQQLCNLYNRKWNNVDIVLCPPSIDLKAVYTVLDFDKTDISLGAQNVHWESSGAYTGEISIPMIKEVGCEYCIVGHSERREMFAETDEAVNRKVKALVASSITPIVCVGESLHLRDSGEYKEFVCAQVRAALAGLDELEMKSIVFAYEPIWAIGTGRTATAEQANETIGYIRSVIERAYGREVAEAVRIQYGGSVNPSNIKELMAQEHIDGALVGGASLDPKSFLSLVNYQG